MSSEAPSLPASVPDHRATGRNPEFQAILIPKDTLPHRSDGALTQVYVEPTSLCNLDCRICLRKSWDEATGAMGADTYQNLMEGLRQMPSLRRVSFWGIGEPLLHPQIASMVAQAKEIGAETQIITNGLLLDRAKAKGLVEAGLDRLIVSLDSVSTTSQPDARSGDQVAQVCQNVSYFRELSRADLPLIAVGSEVKLSPVRNNPPSHRPEIGVAFVLMKSNLRELKQLRSLAYSLGASSISVTNLLPYAEEMRDEILYPFSVGRSYPTEASQWYPKVSFPRTDVSPELFDALPELLGFTSSFGGAEPPDANRDGYCRFVDEGSIAVNWQGNVSPCVPLMHSYSCYILGRKKQIKQCVLGNLKTERLNEIWESSEFERIRRVVRRFPFSPCTDCGGCNLSDTNEQDCLGNVFPVCGDCLWAKGVIQCP